MRFHPERIRCAVFDFGFTLCSDLYFKIAPVGHPEWRSVIQEQVFARPEVAVAWMKGELNTHDIAGIISKYISLDIPTIVDFMDRGCRDLDLNPAVREFAAALKASGRKTALVTDNMDVFTRVVVPCHGLEQLFDVILNSSDHHEIDKRALWPLAFERLGSGIGYADSLLIEDGETEPALFRAAGGRAYQYMDDAAFLDWLAASGWNEELRRAGVGR